MPGKVIKEIQDLTYLRWSHIRSSSGTAGTFLKSESSVGGIKKYYKLSNFDSQRGIIGHECVNEIIVDRLLTLFGIEHLSYELIHADIELDGMLFETYLCCSEDFKEKGESKVALDDYFRVNAQKGESHYDFCVRNGWKEYIDTMIIIDYLILNRDRHGANIEVLRNARAKTLRIAPLFDHGLSFLYSCMSEKEASGFNVLEERPCNNFIGGRSCYENLGLIGNNRKLLAGKLKEKDRDYLFMDLKGILPDICLDKIWEMLFKRYRIYENL